MSFESSVPKVEDPLAMRALAHPVRLGLLEALADAGTLTATQAAEHVGESPSSCSFHLRQLAKYGWIEEADRGTGRQRPWKLARAGFRFDDGSPEARVLTGTLRERHLARLHRAWAARGDLPAGWRDSTGDAQFLLYVTEDEWRGLNDELMRLLTRFQDRVADPAARPAGAQAVEALVFTYPRDLP